MGRRLFPSMKTDLTIWIPTKNRPEFLERVLYYYSKTAFSGVLFVGDSSEGEALERNRESIENYSQSLQVYYQYFPGLGQGQVSASLVPEIETEYSTFLSDDDLIVTEAVNPIMARLNGDAQLSGMNGKALTFNVLNDNAWGIVSNVHWYPLASLPQPTPSERVAEYFSSVKNTNMCIQRTSVQKTVFGEFIQGNNPFTICILGFTHGCIDMAYLVMDIQFLNNRIFTGNRFGYIPFCDNGVDKN